MKQADAKKALVTEFVALSRTKKGFEYDASEMKEISRKSAVVLRSGIAKMADLPDYVADPSVAGVPEAFAHSYSYMMNFHKGGVAAKPAQKVALLPPPPAAGTITDAQLKFFLKLFLEKHGIDLEDEKHATLLAGARKLTKFKASQEIATLLKLPTLQVVAPVNTPAPLPSGTVAIPDGIYAIQHDGEPKCYEVSNGKTGSKWEGFIFLDRVSSDDRYSIRNRDEKARILDAIRADVEAAAVLAALTLKCCRGRSERGRPCRRTLSDTTNPYYAYGYGPDCGPRFVSL